jgi:opacity protein-like surface antigen
MSKCAIILLGITLASGIAVAQAPSGNLYFGYTYYNTGLSQTTGSLNGFQATLEGKVAPVLGIVADFTGHYGSLSSPVFCSLCTGPVTASTNAHQYEVMFGPRVSFSVSKFRPFAEFELGVGHLTTNGVPLYDFPNFASSTSYATALGGGLDYKIFSHIGWRLEGDYVRTHFFGVGQNNFRLSTGIAFRF